MRRILCVFGFHDWEIVFPFCDASSYSLRLVGQEVCKCCGKKGNVF